MNVIHRAKHVAKSAIDLLDGTTFRARPTQPPEGPAADFYQQNGYAIFRGALSRAKIAALRAAIESEVLVSDGVFLRHKSVQREPHDFIEAADGRKVLRNALLDPHAQPETPRVAAAIDDLLLVDEVADLVARLDGAENYTLHQTILFFTPPGTAIHIDGWGFDTEPRG